MDIKHASPGHTHAKDPCADDCEGLPDFKRLNYFYGQMLGVGDFRAEQSYFREKLKLHNRCLHGYGTLCGLLVVPNPAPEECEPYDDRRSKALRAQIAELERQAAELRRQGKEAEALVVDRRAADLKAQLQALPAADCEPPVPPTVRIECGVALDCEGNEIVVRHALVVDPYHYLSAEDRKVVDAAREGDSDARHALYLSICHCEQPVDPVRPVMPNACGATDACAYGKVRDSFRVRVTLEPPTEDTRCDQCCTPCGEPCLLLAVIRGYRKGASIGEDAIDNSVRRIVGTHEHATTITAISWTHGATYSAAEVGRIIGANGDTKGIKVTFSRPVLTATLQPGVVDLWVVEGGRTNRAGVFYLEGDFEDLDRTQRTVTSFHYRYQGDETLDPGDRVFVTIRTPFLLDDCCRSVLGLHNGGVPIDAAFREFEKKSSMPTQCAIPRGGYGPWTAGPHGNFESWFYVQLKEPKK